MHLNRFDLNLLVALDALLTERNVTRAAERVFIAQPAMSRALARLRRQFDDPLLIRVGRELRLTPVAQALIEPVRDALLQVQAALGTRPAFDPARSQRVFSLMVPDFVAPLLMPGVLRNLMAESDSVQVRLENWSSTGPDASWRARSICSSRSIRRACSVCANFPIRCSAPSCCRSAGSCAGASRPFRAAQAAHARRIRQVATGLRLAAG